MVFVSHDPGISKDIPGRFRSAVFPHRLYATKRQTALRQFPGSRLRVAYIFLANSCLPASEHSFIQRRISGSVITHSGERVQRGIIIQKKKPAQCVETLAAGETSGGVLGRPSSLQSSSSGGQAVLMTRLYR
jgi:hypothetical protein